MRKKSRRGFTLVEMLIVTVMISVMAVAIFNAFNNALKLWARGVVMGHEGDMAISLDRMAEDLRSIAPVTQIAFKGSQYTLVFPCLVLTAADKHGSRSQEGIIDQIGAVEYRYDPATGTLYRRQANYGQALKKQWGPSQVMVKGIDELSFKYQVPGENGYVTKGLLQDRLPAGVFLKVHLASDEPGHFLNRYMAIPVGGR